MKIPKELIKEYVKSENFTNTTDIMESIKTMFADVLNEVLQCELDEQLGYDKHTRTESDEEKKNYRNGSTKRKLKTQLERLKFLYRVTETVSMNQRLLININAMLTVWKIKFFRFMLTVCLHVIFRNR